VNAESGTDPTTRILYYGAIASYIGLILLVLLWEGWLAPSPHPSAGFWLAVKTVPLLLPARGVIRGNPRTIVLASLVVLLYFIEGVVLAYSSHGPGGLSRMVATLASLEIILSTGFIVLAGQFVRRAFRRR
jgi:uncharacterized membrane protein